MIFQNYPFFFISFICAVISGFSAYYAWKRRKVRSADSFTYLMILITWWVFFEGFEYISADSKMQFLFLNLEYLVIPWIPGALIWFSLKFGGYDKYCTRESFIIIFLVPALIFLSFYTNDIFHLFYHSITYVQYQGLTVPSFIPGVMYRVLNITVIAAQVFCFIVLIKVLLQSPRVFRLQMAVLIMSIFLLFVSMVFFFLIPRPFPNFDPIPPFLVIINLLVLISIFRFQLFDLIHIPYHAIFDNLEEGILVLDSKNRIIQINPRASKMLGIVTDHVIGEYFNSFISILLQFGDQLNSNDINHLRLDADTQETGLSLLIDIYPVLDSSGMVQSRMIIMRDITEITKTSRALTEAGKKLNLLNSITRHDIINQVAIITGYASLVSDTIRDDSEAVKQIDYILSASDSIKKLIQFTATYQDLGIGKPIWLDVDEMVRNAWNTLHPPDSIVLTVNTHLEIFADMLLEKVFFNLMDNSLRHGISVTKITISFYEEERGFLLIYQDNGHGIEPGLKEKIFSRGFGKNTGYGLFLVREILSITGIVIKENGLYGEGVRFEMTIPKQGGRIKN
ncbi:histidine kinase N-terminal 7TM domain-containing protein [Methanospirillum hungatei]|uniref:histidine kinase N-terminal 7TM domain-containing protein n=1 Tax=Methanospirillum hungatei TaxID=2203 RepID=UPI0026EAD5A2|nr:histidine kinase N-terminal 7TM domain-containing protein [Methanospirillum hungatei]MCA1916962.1 PAS domain S-box protein [Methanospirillum hungatei]